jgi:peptidyl-prolyl cis-trans isomerase SurA
MNKMKVLVLLMVIVFANMSNSSATDQDPVLMTINGRKITPSEFEYVYTKNNLNTQVIDPKTVDEYLELFINFNLKVYDALQLGLDTHQTFITELEGYRKQLAQPYLNDQNVTNELLEEALERMKYDLRASHILVSLESHASPSDTLVAWKKINDLRKRALAGEDFGELAKNYSDDPSAKGMPATANRPAMRPNYGDLGYFNVLDMVYPFESAAYNTKPNEISMPVRTSFGYHIIKVTDRLPAMGRARVAHLMINAPADSPQEEIDQARIKIEEIYQKIQEGESFEELVQLHSDDKASARRNGELPSFNSNRMVPEFIKAISTLDTPEEISPPVRTQFGWHLIKFIEKQKPTQEEAIADLRTRIGRDSRATLSQKVVIDRIKAETEFTENHQNLEPFFTIVDQSIFQGRWVYEDQFNPNGKLFSFADQTITQNDFLNYLRDNQSMRSPESVRNFINSRYADYVKQKLIEFEENNLEEKYTEFRKIMREYHDGILLFELTDQKVWSKAMQDTTGLREFYTRNISNYMWDDRLDAIIFTFSSEEMAKSARSKIRRNYRRKAPNDQLIKELNQNSQLDVIAEKGLFEQREKPLLGEIKWSKGVSPVFTWHERYYLVQVNNVLPAQPKKLNEIRGLVIADYQNYLEDKWVEELRQKYSFSVDKSVLKSLSYD